MPFLLVKKINPPPATLRAEASEGRSPRKGKSRAGALEDGIVPSAPGSLSMP